MTRRLTDNMAQLDLTPNNEVLSPRIEYFEKIPGSTTNARKFSQSPSSDKQVSPKNNCGSSGHGIISNPPPSPELSSGSQVITHTKSRIGPGDKIEKPCLRCGAWTYNKGERCDGCGLVRYADWWGQNCDFCQSPDHELANCLDSKKPLACHLCGHGHLRMNCPVFALQGTTALENFAPQFTPLRFKKFQHSIWTAANSQLAKKPDPGVKQGESTEIATNCVNVRKVEKSNGKLYKYKIILGDLSGCHGKDKTGMRMFDREQNTALKTSKMNRNASPVSTSSKSTTSQQSMTPVDQTIRRELIHNLLQENRPSARSYVTDYHSVIISVGELYKRHLMDNKGCYITPHKYDVPDKSITRRVNIHSKLQPDGHVNIDDLMKYPQLEDPNKEFNPNQTAAALKVIVSNRMNSQMEPCGKNGLPSPPRFNARQLSKLHDPTEARRLSVKQSPGTLLLCIRTKSQGTKDPQETYDDIDRYVNNHFGQNKAKFTEDFGVSIGQALMPLKSRILGAPSLNMSLTKTAPKILHVISVQEVPNQKMPEKSSAKDANIQNLVAAFGQLTSTLKSLGESRSDIKVDVQVANVLVGDEYSKTWMDSVIHGLSDALQKMRPKPTSDSVVVVVLPKHDQAMYSCVKFWGDCLKGIRTACLLRKNIDGADKNKMMKFARSMSVKVFSKLGNVDYTIERRGKSNIVTKNTMIAGTYLSHGSSSSYPAVAGLVATCDGSGAKYLASARLQPGDLEYIGDLASMIWERVLFWFEKNKTLPSEILLYRGGISEGQFGMIKLQEVTQVRQGFDEAVEFLIQSKKLKKPLPGQPTYDAKVTVVSVVKQQHTRFYTVENTDSKKPTKNVQNAAPGLVVDSKIVNGENFNFFLQSHVTSNASSKNAHYTVIENGMCFTESELESWTYNLCFPESRDLYRKGLPGDHTKASSNVAVNNGLSICMPARYAEYLCDRVRCYIRQCFYQMNDQKNITGKNEVDFYKKGTEFWMSQCDTNRQNPWHMRMDDQMFYL